MVTSQSMTVNAYAKINLFLEVKEKLANGYHNLETVMQSVTLCDSLTVTKKDSGIDLECIFEGKDIKDNIVIKAASAFFRKAQIKGGADIKLVKRIPVESGLGGGSADAAATLYALNELYGAPVSEQDLYKAAKEIGADVPFCLKKGLCEAEGIGEILTDIGRLPDCIFLISIGSESVSTKEAFDALDRKAGRISADKRNILSAVAAGDIIGISNALYNCFEIINCGAEKIKRIMMNNGALGASLSGSGPSVFGIYDEETKAVKAADELQKLGYRTFACKPYYRSK